MTGPGTGWRVSHGDGGPSTRADELQAWRLSEGECLAGLSSMPDGSVDAVLIDPPYEVVDCTLSTSGRSHSLF